MRGTDIGLEDAADTARAVSTHVSKVSGGREGDDDQNLPWWRCEEDVDRDPVVPGGGGVEVAV